MHEKSFTRVPSPAMPSFSPIGDTLRHIHRYREILEVLIATGLADAVREFGLDGLVGKGYTLLSKTPPPEITSMTRAQRLRRALEQLGPTYIKMGQVLSTRPDLIPQEWADEFAHLQADVPALPYETIKTVLIEEFGDRLPNLFTQIDETPLAAASIAQAHAATLPDGTQVVLKVRRPGIEEVTKTDLEILDTLAGIVEHRFSNLGYSPREVINEFARELNKEIDFTHEGRATERMQNAFEDDIEVFFPNVFWEATTRRVLTIERINGTLFTNLKPSDLTAEERHRMVSAGCRAVLRQTLEIGFFHADPHPGNLFALDGGRIAFIDCGMTGQIDRRTRENLADLVHGVVTNDLEKVVRVVGELGDVEPKHLNNRMFLADVRDFMSHFANTPLEHLDLGRLLLEFFHKLRAHNLRCPADLVLLIKALTTIEGVAEKIDPTFNLMEVARPFVERLVRERFGPRAIRRRMQKTFADYAALVERLPGDLKQIVDSVNRERLTINLEHHRLDKLTETIEHASRNISWSLIVASLFVGSAILVLANRGNTTWGLSTLGLIGFFSAATMVFVRWVLGRFR